MSQSVHVIDGGSRHSLNIPDQSYLAEGGAGKIYRLSDARYPETVAKIYHQADQCERAKIQAMLDAPPEGVRMQMNGRQVPMLTWPTHLLENDQGQAIGYLMPYVDTSLAVSMDTYIHEIESLPEQDQSISLRVIVARNLAAALAAMHEKRDYFIDLKPQNILVFKETGNVCLLDCDGFAIGGGRYPARQYSSQYMMPEILINRVDPQALALNDHQDRFALAVLAFQILNYGAHPFQGIPHDQSIEDANTDEFAKRGWYAYGLTPSPDISPQPQSIHEYWDTETRQLFDRAFTAKRPSQRPAAAEWREHLDRLIRNKAFAKCERFPDEVVHIHFKEKPCFVCEKFTAPQNSQGWEKVSRQHSTPTYTPPHPEPLQPPANPQQQSWVKSAVAWAAQILIWAVIIVLVKACRGTL